MKILVQTIIVSSLIFTSVLGMAGKKLRKRKQKQEQKDAQITIGKRQIFPHKWSVNQDMKQQAEVSEKLWQAMGFDGQKALDVNGVIDALEGGANPQRRHKGLEATDQPLWFALVQAFKARDKECYNRYKKIFFVLLQHPAVDLKFDGVIKYNVKEYTSDDYNSGSFEYVLHLPLLYCAVYGSSYNTFCQEDDFEIVGWLLNDSRIDINKKIYHEGFYDCTLLHFMVKMKHYGNFGALGYLGLVSKVINSPDFGINTKGYNIDRDICCNVIHCYLHAQEMAHNFEDFACADLIEQHRNFSNPHSYEIRTKGAEMECVIL